MSVRPLRIMIVDDHPVFRRGLVDMLSDVDGLEVVAEAGDGPSAVERALATAPDVVLMDVQLPVGNGVDATREVVAALPETAVLILTMFDDDASVFAAMRAGASGYLLKGADQDDIVRAVLSAAAGDLVFGQAAARRVRAMFSDPPHGPSRPFPELTEREAHVLELLARGWGNARIAQHLVISDKTVRNHVSNVLTKLAAPDRAAAVLRAREAGLGAVLSPER